MPVPGAMMLVALIAHIGGPMMKVPALGAEHLHLTSPSMGITIADDTAAVVNGQALRYQITVHNSTETETPVTVRVTLSSVTHLHADQAAVVANAVAWKNTLAPGSTRTYSVAGVVDTHAATPDLAATACVHLTADTPAVTCATDLNTVGATTKLPRTKPRLARLNRPRPTRRRRRPLATAAGHPGPAHPGKRLPPPVAARPVRSRTARWSPIRLIGQSPTGGPRRRWRHAPRPCPTLIRSPSSPDAKPQKPHERLDISLAGLHRAMCTLLQARCCRRRIRGMAQFGSASALGAEGRRFKSGYPDRALACKVKTDPLR